MKLIIKVEVDETDDHGLQILEDLEMARDFKEGVRIRTADTGFTAQVLSVEEVR